MSPAGAPPASLRRQLLASLMIQGAGAASVLLATLLLGASLGPALQGSFSRTKSEIEFVAAFAMFGLPQALFFYVKAGRLGRAAALRWAGWSAALALVIGAAYALVEHARSGGVVVVALALAIGLCVAHGQLRGLLLVRQQTAWFNAVTALPQVLLLVAVLAAIASGLVGARVWPWLFAFAYLIATACAARWLRPLRAAASDAPRAGVVATVPTGAPVGAPNEAPNEAPGAAAIGGAVEVPAGAPAGVPAEAPVGAPTTAGWRELGGYGMAAWLSATLATAAILFAQRWVDTSQGAAALGQFTLALTLLQVPLAPIGYAAPLLFRRWMEQPGGRASQRWAAALFVALLAVAVLVWLAAPLWPQLGLGAGYAGVTRVLAVLLVGAAGEAAARVLAANANASGRPWIAVRAEAARWLVLGAGWWLSSPSGLLTIAALWSAAALGAVSIYVLHARLAGRSVAELQ